jgi:hypothetical protein
MWIPLSFVLIFFSFLCGFFGGEVSGDWLSFVYWILQKIIGKNIPSIGVVQESLQIVRTQMLSCSNVLFVDKFSGKYLWEFQLFGTLHIVRTVVGF